MTEFNRKLTAAIPHLRRYARALLNHADLADDLVQDCLERACSRQSLWDSGKPIRPWLFTIMHNIYASNARRFNRAPALVSIDQVEEHASPQGPSPGMLSDLEKGLGMLTPEHREVLLLVGLQQFSYAEASQVLDVPIGTVMSRLTRARNNLKQFMQDPMSARVRRVK